MAIVKKYTYGQSSWAGDASLGKAFFDSLNCSLITATTLVDATTFSITIADTMTLRFDCGTSNSYHAIKLIYGGSETTVGDIRTYESKTFIVAFSNDFIFINKTATNTAEFGFVYEKIGNNVYYGTATGSVVFENLGVTCIQDNITYYHSPRLNYSVDFGYIDFSSSALFTSSTQKANVTDTNLLSCTTVTAKQVITFKGHNYYSIGINTLIPMNIS